MKIGEGGTQVRQAEEAWVAEEDAARMKAEEVAQLRTDERLTRNTAKS